MEYIIGLGLLAITIWAVSKLAIEKLKNQQIEPLKNAIRSNEAKSKKAAADALGDADADRVIGFLNDLHKDDKNLN